MPVPASCSSARRCLSRRRRFNLWPACVCRNVASTLPTPCLQCACASPTLAPTSVCEDVAPACRCRLATSFIGRSTALASGELVHLLACQPAVMPAIFFFCLSKRLAHRALELEAMTGVASRGDREQRRLECAATDGPGV